MQGCTNPDCVADRWTAPYALPGGVIVWTCKLCGQAEIDNSTGGGTEYHRVPRWRDEKGRFISESEAGGEAANA